MKYPFDKYVEVKTRNGNQLTGHAPHRIDKNPSFSVNTETGLWIDHATGEKGNWTDFCKLVPEAKKEIITSEYTYTTKKGSFKKKFRKDLISQDNISKKELYWETKNLEEDDSLLPYNYENLDTTKLILYVEGEKCVDQTVSMGHPNVTTVGSSTGWQKHHAALFKGLHVVICADNDSAGKKQAIEIYNDLKDIAKVQILLLPNLKDKEDIADLIERQELNLDIFINYLNDPKYIKDCIPFEWLVELKKIPPVKVFANIQHKNVEFLDGSDGILPAGMLVAVSGDPGSGKSRFLRKLLAGLSIGLNLSGHAIDPISTLILTSEDHPEAVIKPDLENYFADQNKIFIIESSCELNQEFIDSIRNFIVDNNIKLIVIDTIASYMGNGADLNSLNSVKDFFKPITDFSKEHGLCFVFIRHLNKNMAQGNHIHRGMGSIGITGTVRSEFHVVQNESNPQLRSFIHVKSNFGKKELHCQYSFNEDGTVNIQSIKKEESIEKAYHEITGANLEDVDDTHPSGIGKLEEVKKIIWKLLSINKKMNASDLLNDLKFRGFSEATFKRAKDEICNSTRMVDQCGKISRWEIRLKPECLDLYDDYALDNVKVYESKIDPKSEPTETEIQIFQSLIEKCDSIQYQALITKIKNFGLGSKRADELVDRFYNREITPEGCLLVPKNAHIVDGGSNE